LVTYNQLVPVFVITGYLGSGKTTLINQMLRDPSLSDAAVLVNEFGAVGIDHMLVQEMDENTVLLQSGCICCTIRSDLKDSIIDLNSRREAGLIPRYKRLILETTGLADPSPILFTLNSDMIIKHHYRLGTVITTVDCVNGLAQLSRRSESVKQVLVADRVVLTKPDLVKQEKINRLKSKINKLNPTANVSECLLGNINIKEILEADIYQKNNKGSEVKRWLEEYKSEDHHHLHNKTNISRHDKTIYSFTIKYNKPLDWTAFGIWLTMLLNHHGENILRVKGILNVKGVDAPVVINGVQHVVHPPIHLKKWPSEDRYSHLVFIVDGIDQDVIERSLGVFNGLIGQN
tara:strand:+ start:154050 stop:155087 length:1038 start_codon:yes stop_codon:yes gene_type:complete